MSILKDFPKSPVTGSKNVRSVDTFAVSDIVRLYREQENVAVEKYFRHGENVYLLECEDTKYRFFYPFEIAGDEDFYNNLKREIEKKGLDYDRDWSDDHEFALENIEENEKILEIGCNTGKFLGKISERTKNVTGLEFNPVAAEAAKAKGLKVINESIEAHAKFHENEYDVVCAFQVLEHVTEIRSFISSAVKTLKTGGKLIFSVPNNEPYFQRFGKYEVLNLPPHHVGLWNLESFRKLCGFYDVELVKHYYSGATTLIGETYLRAKYIADVKSLARRHSLAEKVKIYLIAPLAGIRNVFDKLGKKSNYAHITVVFSKK